MIRPPAKLERLPLNAIPTATPAEANRAAKEVVCTPNAPTTEMINKMVKLTLTKLLVKVLMEGSISFTENLSDQFV